MKTENKKNKHMNLDDRIEIQECLCKGMTFKDIAKRIQKDQTTVSKEIKGHLQIQKNSFVTTEEICPHLLKAPFVCNGCAKKSRSNCRYSRQIYSAKKAQSDYETLLVEARTGIPLNKESFYETEKIISAAVLGGQHIYHAITANNLPVSTATVYRHIKKKYYSISVTDLPRLVKFKPRHSHVSEFVPKWAKQGRTYADYISYTSENTLMPIVQLDTVIGKIGGKVIMTIHFVQFDFMAGLLLENKSAAEAASKIGLLKSKLKSLGFNFGEVIPIILTDNGGEFSAVSAFENGENGILESHMFFCEPNSPYEKPHIEKNHTMFRDIVPSGSSFDGFSQSTVDKIFSHVNAVKRKQFNGKSAYEMFTFMYSDMLAKVFGIDYILPEKVIQNPSLLK